MNISYLLLFLSIAAVSQGDVLENELDYLSDYGYYKKNNKDLGSMSGKKEVQNSIESFQKFLGLPVTGVIDKTTKEIMKKPRCGLKDILDDKVTRKRRFTLHGTKWRKNNITWKLLNDNNDGLSRKEVETLLEKAFQKWEAIADLTFNKLSFTSKEQADIDIKFVQGDHGDAFSFRLFRYDLAHAFYPLNNQGISGDVHFNDIFNFNVKEKNGVNLFWAAIHEIGHSLGLHHSSFQGSLMYPTYLGNKEQNIQLHEDDILGIQSMYGSKRKPILPSKKTANTNNTQVTQSKTHLTTSKNHIKVQAIILDQLTGITYVFNEDKYYKLSINLNETYGPFNVSELLTKITYVNGGFINREKKLVFFQGTKYYMFDSFANRNFIESGSVFDLFKGIKKNVEKIDGAFVAGNGTTYLFSGNDYYQYSSKQKTIESSSPKKIAEYWKVPTNIDSVFVWRNGGIYFFKGLQFYRVNQNGGLMKGYPKNIDDEWFKIPKNM
ncbi:matrix metalloproteinase-18 [Hydra vulgaris]|uniref:matrix metalloproteinase-18 n=1 Tax=Hydra vulgaris TaxID=6087 RepID=UPI001F5FDB72|nr:matrix metalloproteinase-18-like [Hydra vulgaris]